MAYDIPSDDAISRIIKAPDGIDYIVTMDGWYWNSLDWMHENTDWKEADFINLAWRVSRQMENDGTMKHPGDFSSEFAYCFKAGVCLHMNDLINKENGLANDDINM